MDQIVFGTGVAVAFHPVNYVKTLIQLGHEPLPPVQTTIPIFGTKRLIYPNALKYMKHIKSRDGFLGLYRGVSGRIVGCIASSFTAQYVTTKLKEVRSDLYREIEDDPEEGSIEDIKRSLADTCIETLSRCSGIIVSQPFVLLMTRWMAQFVNNESKYGSTLSSVQVIYKEEGISGFFKGLVARLVGEVMTIWLVNALVYVTDRYILPGNKTLAPFNNTASTMMVTQFTYPFHVVATNMMVTGCGLSAGSPPNMPPYDSWTHCYATLSRQNALKRGSSLFWRYYRGPTSCDLMSGDIIPLKMD